MGDAPRDLRARIEALVGVGPVLPVLERGAPAYLVGGAVRDLLRGETTRDIDVAVEGPADPVARALAARLGGEVESHERFGTATVRTADLSLDLATARRERYPRPGALPEVESAPIEEDLARRDFSVNAMAAPLAAARRGDLLDLHGGRDDLEDGVIRVLHRASFVDDPTRLLRAVRYEARLGFAMDVETERLARAAIADNVSDTLSRSRLGAELLLLLAEERLEAALARLVDLGLDRALGLEAEPGLAVRAAGAADTTGGVPALAALAALVPAAPAALADRLDGFGLNAAERGRVARAASSAPSLVAALGEDHSPSPSASGLRELLAPEPPEALALALALGAPLEPIAHYVEGLRSVRLAIGGDDLIAAGAEPSPALGRALEETLRRKLDGQVVGREDELRVALALVRGENGRT